MPGGVVEPGELLTEALTREVQEETGLMVRQIGRLAYIAQLDRSLDGSQSWTFVFDVVAWDGALRIADPDTVILDAQFCRLPDAIHKLHALPWRVMREPAIAYLQDEGTPGGVWLYRQANDER